MEYDKSRQSSVVSHQSDRRRPEGRGESVDFGLWAEDCGLSTLLVWPVVSPPDAIWKDPYSARFHGGASVPGG